MEQVARPRAQAYSASDPPPIAPRRDLQSLALRRYHSSDHSSADQARKPSEKPYESEYDKLNRFLRNSLNAKSRNKRHEVELTGAATQHNASKLSSADNSGIGKPAPNTPQTVFEEDEELYLCTEEIASLPSKQALRGTRSNSPIPTTSSNAFNFTTDASPTTPRYVANPQKKDFRVETAIYGVAQGKGENLVMELKELQKNSYSLYRKMISTNSNSPQMADLRTHLRAGDKAPIDELLIQVYQTLQPPEPHTMPDDDYSGIYLVDFRDCKEKALLREKIQQLFATPGPPSVAYQKLTAKLDAVIRDFVDLVVKMRVKKNETLVSPHHAQSIIQSIDSGQEGDQLIRVLQSNELWIRWGTEIGLPPLSHIFMLKQPPTYEMRKAITLSMIAERRDAINAMLPGTKRNEIFMPPVYSKLASEDDDKWQVTEFDKETRKFETYEVDFPLWVEECPKLAAHLKSHNRTAFKTDEHIYALYSVYLIVIKDITLTAAASTKENRMPCSHQVYVGSSSTGVLYRFLNVEDKHCDSVRNILEECATMKSFRCHQETELVEACLALSWLRRQPRAVFVINSFQEGDMANLSLNKKKPYHDKMLTLEQHYINSKKLGPTNDMRYGMNRLGNKMVA